MPFTLNLKCNSCNEQHPMQFPDCKTMDRGTTDLQRLQYYKQSYHDQNDKIFVDEAGHYFCIRCRDTLMQNNKSCPKNRHFKFFPRDQLPEKAQFISLWVLYASFITAKPVRVGPFKQNTEMIGQTIGINLEIFFKDLRAKIFEKLAKVKREDAAAASTAQPPGVAAEKSTDNDISKAVDHFLLLDGLDDESETDSTPIAASASLSRRRSTLRKDTSRTLPAAAAKIVEDGQVDEYLQVAEQTTDGGDYMQVEGSGPPPPAAAAAAAAVGSRSPSPMADRQRHALQPAPQGLGAAAASGSSQSSSRNSSNASTASSPAPAVAGAEHHQWQGQRGAQTVSQGEITLALSQLDAAASGTDAASLEQTAYTLAAVVATQSSRSPSPRQTAAVAAEQNSRSPSPRQTGDDDDDWGEVESGDLPSGDTLKGASAAKGQPALGFMPIGQYQQRRPLSATTARAPAHLAQWGRGLDENSALLQQPQEAAIPWYRFGQRARAAWRGHAGRYSLPPQQDGYSNPDFQPGMASSSFAGAAGSLSRSQSYGSLPQGNLTSSLTDSVDQHRDMPFRYADGDEESDDGSVHSVHNVRDKTLFVQTPTRQRLMCRPVFWIIVIIILIFLIVLILWLCCVITIPGLALEWCRHRSENPSNSTTTLAPTFAPTIAPTPGHGNGPLVCNGQIVPASLGDGCEDFETSDLTVASNVNPAIYRQFMLQLGSHLTNMSLDLARRCANIPSFFNFPNLQCTVRQISYGVGATIGEITFLNMVLRIVMGITRHPLMTVAQVTGLVYMVWQFLLDSGYIDGNGQPWQYPEMMAAIQQPGNITLQTILMGIAGNAAEQFITDYNPPFNGTGGHY